MATRFRTAFLDAGGVLVYPNWQRVSGTLGRYGVSVEPATLAAAEPAVKRSLDVAPTVRATNDSQRGFLYFDLILKSAGIDRSDATDAALAELKAFNDVDGAWDDIALDAVAALVRLRDAGMRTVVVSNSNGTLRHMFRRIGLAAHVDLMIDSMEEKVEKPNPRLFQIALARSGSDAATTIHCGDLYEIDVVGARAAGLPAVLLDTAGIYGAVDCPRVGSLTEYADGLIAGRFD